MSDVWVPVGAVATVSAVLIPLTVPYLKRNSKRRTERRTDDIMWNGRKGSRGLPEVLPMWQRMDNVEKGLAAIQSIDERTKTLEPDGNGGHSTYDLVRKLAENAGIDTGEPK